MIAETRMGGTIDQIDGVVYFKSKTLATYSVLRIKLTKRHCNSYGCHVPQYVCIVHNLSMESNHHDNHVKVMKISTVYPIELLVRSFCQCTRPL